ncbi:MAG TPA: hypothetical protein VGC57_04980 [Cellulomonas sp.]
MSALEPHRSGDLEGGAPAPRDGADAGGPVDVGSPGTSWRTGNRAIVVLAVVAVVGLVAGLVLSRFVINPADAAARTAAPQAGPITVPVESRELSNDVTIRGDVAYDDAVDLRVETADLGERAVVTGQVPEVGATLDAGSVALEIAGRPVIVLPGDLPTYRTLRSGVSGPDVVQLKAALAALGIATGDPASDTYDTATAAGVRALYQRVGYPAPTPTDDEQSAVEAGEQAVRSAQAEVTSAGGALSSAANGATLQSKVLQADAAVRQAERARDVARAALADRDTSCAPGGDPGMLSCTGAERLELQSSIDDAQDAVDIATAERTEVGAAPDTSAERASLTSAQQMLADAKEQLAKAQEATTTVLPASEVVFLQTVPRRVDAVDVRRGATVEGSVMSVSGATLQVVASASRADAELLTVGDTGTISLDGTDLPVTVTAIDAAGASGTTDGSTGSDGSGSGDDPGSGSGSGRYTVTFQPGDLTPEQVAALQGSNVRVSVPVSSTGGAVLAVPLAALTAGPGGESRVEVLGDDDESELVEVTTGLAAGGYVEVTGVGRVLTEGELVVVGVSGSDGATDEATADAGTDA